MGTRHAYRPLREKALELRRLRRLSNAEVHKELGCQTALTTVMRWLATEPLTQVERRKKAADANRRRHQRHIVESKFSVAARGVKFTGEQKAQISEAAVLFRLAVHGFVVFKPSTPSSKVDWLVLVDDRVLKIQVKWATPCKTGRPHVSLRCCAGRSKNKLRRYRPGEFDFLVGYEFLTDTAYVYSEAEVARCKNTISILDAAAERWDKLTRM